MEYMYTNKQLMSMNVLDVYNLVINNDGVKQFPNGFWMGEDSLDKANQCTKYMIESVLKWDCDDIRNKLSNKTFTQNKLGGMLTKLFNNSPYEALNSAYPGEFKPWELKTTPNKFWNKETGIMAIKWTIEEKLKLTDEELKEQLSKKFFVDNGLASVLNYVFNKSPYDAISQVYPNKFKPTDFKCISRNYCTYKHGKRMLRWIIEDVLNLSNEELKSKLSIDMFKEQGYGDIIEYCFDGDLYQAISVTYPWRFKREDFKAI